MGTGEAWSANADYAVSWDSDQQLFLSQRLDDSGTSTPLYYPDYFPDAPSGANGKTSDWEGLAITDSLWVETYVYRTKAKKVLATTVVAHPLDGSDPWAFQVSGSVPFVFPGSGLAVLQQQGSTLRKCQAAIDASPTCTTVRTTSSGSLTAGAFGDTLAFTDKTGSYLWDGGTPVKLKVPSGTSVESGAGGDDRPILVATGGATTSVDTVDDDGSLVPTLPAIDAPLLPTWIDAGNGWVSGLDGEDLDTAWVRERRNDGSLGARQVISTQAGDISTSGSRFVVQEPKALVFYDRGGKAQSTAKVSAIHLLSGPYVLMRPKASGSWELRGPRGTLAKGLSSQVSSLGSLVAVMNTAKRTVTVTDKADTGRPAITVSYDDHGGEYVGGAMWGDWLALSFAVETGTDGLGDPVYAYATTLLNYRDTSRQATFTGWIHALGDGVALGRHGDTDVVWSTDGSSTDLGDEVWSGSSFDDAGTTIGYADSDEVVLRSVAGAGASAPRALGVLADSGCNAFACDWTLEVDATRALEAGSLVITGTGTAAGASHRAGGGLR